MPATYIRHAVACLAITVLAGAWLRIALLQPGALGPFAFRHAVHAHSHVALFGWTTMALFALILRAAGGAPRWARWHAHAVGAAALAAFPGFLLVGYAAPTIALATLHVLLWVAFALAIRRPLAGAATPVERRYFGGALALLLVAGAGAMVPGVARAAGATDPWLLELSVQLFLTPFMEGWLALGVAGALYARIERPRFARAVLPLLAAGALPAALLRTAAPAPLEWIPWLGRAGTLAVGLGAVLLAGDVLRAPRLGPLLRLAGAAALLKGAVEVGVASGVGLAFVGNHQLTVAYLHLVLLGMVTPALLGTAVAPRDRSVRLALAQGAGLATTLGALAVLGLPPLARMAAAAGVSGRTLLGAALLGGVVSAAGVLGVVAGRARASAAWRRAPA